MSTADVIKQLKIKTNSLKRLNKELASYEKEKDKETAKVAALKAAGGDVSDIKQAENVLHESTMMVPETRSRLETALQDLQSYVVENEADIKDSKELEEATEVLAAVEAVFAA